MILLFLVINIILSVSCRSASGVIFDDRPSALMTVLDMQKTGAAVQCEDSMMKYEIRAKLFKYQNQQITRGTLVIAIKEQVES